jgi:hypothetical protein
MSRTLQQAAIALTLSLAATAPALAGDESKHWSQIVLGQPKLSDPRQAQLVMIAVDGERDFSPETFYPLAPGKHEFAVAPTIEGTLGELRFIAFTLDMAPCTTYELIASRQPGTSIDNRNWMPVVRSAKPIKRCLKKFGLTAPDKDAPLPAPVVAPTE